MGHYNLFDYWCLMIGISVLCTALIACRHTVSGSISLPSPGFFSPFPHGTCALSVIRMVFSLGGWSPQLPTRFHVPCGTQDTASVSAAFRLRACHPLRMSFPEHSAMLQRSYLCGPTTPIISLEPGAWSKEEKNSQLIALCSKLTTGLGSSPFARRY